MWIPWNRRSFCNLLGALLVGLLTPLRTRAQGERKIRRVPVQSTHLVSIGYDPAQRTLEIEFRDGAVYRYFQVPAKVYEAVLSAESKGRFFTNEIRGRYRFVRLTAISP